MTRVPFNYLNFQFRDKKKYFSAWKKLIDTSEFTLGPYIENFEKLFARYIGVKHCISTNNGTDALILSLKSLGVREGDEVITVCNSFYATAGAIHACGAKIVFVDCDDRYQIDVNKIEKAITTKTKVILPVHWGGASPEISRILKIAKKYNIKVVEDACMGIGAKILKRSPGSFGNVNAFSMHPLKSLNVMGDGGMIATNDNKIANWLRKYRNHGMIDRDNLSMWGVNVRMQPLQAVVAEIELKRVEEIVKKRNKNAKYLDDRLSKIKQIKIPTRIKNYRETFALYMACFKNRNKLQKYLLKNNVEVKIHYPIPLHLQAPAKKIGFNKGQFPEAEFQSKNLLTLPVHQYLNIKQLKYMADKIEVFYK